MDLDQILHRAKLRSVLLRYTRDHDLVEDLCQIARVKCWRYVCQHDADPPNGFVRVVGIRAFFSSWRKKKRTPQALPTNYDRGSEAPNPSEALERAEQSLLVRSAIEELPRRYESPAKLHFVDGLTCSEIATQTGRSLATVKTWIHRAGLLLATKLRHRSEN